MWNKQFFIKLIFRLVCYRWWLLLHAWWICEKLRWRLLPTKPHLDNFGTLKMTAGATVLSMLNPVWKNDTISEKGKPRGLERQKFKMAAAGPETVKVIVRCRPMNRRENDLKCVVSIFSLNIDLFFVFLKQLKIVYLHPLLPLPPSQTQNTKQR